jgi:hypothetical protein
VTSDLVSSPLHAVLSRRNALRLALMTVPAVAGLTIPTVASAAPGRPSGSGYVRYEDLYRPGDDLQSVVNKVTGNRILTLPVGSFTVRDFTNGNYDGIRIGTGPAAGCRGLAGSGRDTVVSVAANTASRVKDDGFAGNQLTLAKKSGGVLTNFTLKGYQQNGHTYTGLVVNTCPDAKLSWLYLKGGSRGYSQNPPGETFGINVMSSPRVTLSDSEVDGRDDSGRRVGASPIGWNNTRDAKVYRTYCHHGVAGMMTFYNVTNIYSEDYRAFATSSGPGSLTGSGINHEQSQGTIKHVRPSLFVHGRYSGAAGASDSTGMHISLQNTKQDLTDVQILEPTWDPGPGSTGMFAFSIRDGYTIAGQRQKVVTTPTVVKNGITLRRSDHPLPGWGDKDPDRYFSWVH